MRLRFNMYFQADDEKTGDIVRNSKIDIYLDVLDNCSLDYLKNTISTACGGMCDIISDMSTV
jgi:hypothetical protein